MTLKPFHLPRRAAAVLLTLLLSSSAAAPGARAQMPVLAGVPVTAPARAVEARALWVSRYEYDSAARVTEIMQKAKDAGFNLVYFQVRGMSDALYRSTLEPCGVALCGRLGGTPTWDPLEVAVREAHARGLELHAWMNALPGWAASRPEVCSLLRESLPGNPRHILLERPDLAVRRQSGASTRCPTGDSWIEYTYLSPGNPEVRERIARVAADIATRYRVDGVHLDHIRYPGRDFSYDPASTRAWNAARAANPGYSFDQFRRDQVTATVAGVREALNRARPGIVLSAAVWGIYEDRWGWNSSSGANWFFQDPRAWADRRLLDVAVPMTYYRINREYCGFADFACLADDQLNAFRQRNTPVYLGIIADYGATEIVREIEMARAKGAAGVAIFSVNQLDRQNLWRVLRDGPFREPARVR